MWWPAVFCCHFTANVKSVSIKKKKKTDFILYKTYITSEMEKRSSRTFKCNIILPTIIIMTSGQQNSPFAAFCFLVAADTTNDDDDACPSPPFTHHPFAPDLYNVPREPGVRYIPGTRYMCVHTYKSYTRRRPAARHSTLLPTPNFSLSSVRVNPIFNKKIIF